MAQFFECFTELEKKIKPTHDPTTESDLNRSADLDLRLTELKKK